jgi:hypothetical protein
MARVAERSNLSQPVLPATAISEVRHAERLRVFRDNSLAELEPFGEDWPDLAPAGDGQDPDGFADQYVRDNDDGTSRIMLVPAVRGPRAAGRGRADVGRLGRSGELHPAKVPALFGAAELGGTVRRPAHRGRLRHASSRGGRSPGLALACRRVAAEHFAFCPDNIVQGLSGGTIRGYAAKDVLGQAEWSFWWD